MGLRGVSSPVAKKVVAFRAAGVGGGHLRTSMTEGSQRCNSGSAAGGGGGLHTCQAERLVTGLGLKKDLDSISGFGVQ